MPIRSLRIHLSTVSRYGLAGLCLAIVVLSASFPSLRASAAEKPFSIEYLTPVSVGNNAIILSLRTQAVTGSYKVSVLSATNTQSDLYSFIDRQSSRKTVTTLTVDASAFTAVPGSPGVFTTTLAVNTPDIPTLSVTKTGVYPVSIIHSENEKTTSTQYSFLTYIASVGENGMAFATRLNVAPVVSYAPYFDRTQFFNTKGSLTKTGHSVLSEFSRAQKSFATLATLDVAHSVVVSPEALDTYSYLDASIAQKDPLFLPSPTGEYIVDTYVPVNLGELEKMDVSREYTQLLSTGRSVISEHNIAAPARTLITQSISPSMVSLVAQSGIDHVIVDDSTFPSSIPTEGHTFTLKEGAAQITAGVAHTETTTHDLDAFSESSQANYLTAISSVIALQAPSRERGLIVPLDAHRFSETTLREYLLSLRGNPLLTPVTTSQYFSQLTSDKTLTSRIEKSRYPSTATPVYTHDQIAAFTRYTNAITSVFASTTHQARTGSWLSYVIYSSHEHLESANITVARVRALATSASRYIALPEKRTLTITSRENDIPVTLRNTSGAPLQVTVTIDSDKLSFPKGTRFSATLAQENTTISIPVRARTSGAFPLKIKVYSAQGAVLIGEQQVTVRSTAVSGAGVAIAITSAIFLALWWISHIRKSKVKPLADVIELERESTA